MTWQHCLGLDLEVPDDFGNWLAGFVDGEGCFYITVNPNNRSVSCKLFVRLRDDDVAILREIKETLGIGKLYECNREFDNRRGIDAHNQAEWCVRKISDVIHVIIPLFEKYPLRAKKKRDFTLWTRAARIIHVGAHLTEEGREEVLRLKQEMEKGRKYNGDDNDDS